MDEKSALEEAKRCLSCGICEECLECVKTCVGHIPDYEEGGETISLDIGAVILSSGKDWLTCHNLRKDTEYRWKVISPIAEIEEEKCIACGECRNACEFDAIEKSITQLEFKGLRDSLNSTLSITRYKSKVLPDVCRGCGACFAICPVGAISLKYFSSKQLTVMIEPVIK